MGKGFANPRETWDARFSTEDYIFGTEPNAWLAQHANLLRPGMRVLAVADGEGRNSVWMAKQGLQVDAFDISPIGIDKAKKLAAVSVDESLVTEADATSLFRDRSCDMLNLRLSKLGGLAATLRMATTAHAESMDYQVGCQVGETAILSAVGRHLAAHLVPRYVEGSFGAHLLAVEPDHLER